MSDMEKKKKYRLLLLTNRDSDNLGDQVIEVTDIQLISTVMQNLGISNYHITSRAAGIVTQKYLKTKDPELLEGAKKTIAKQDLIVFGGAPLFNYKYQTFYERTAVTLEMCEEYHKPVIFSAIGVEGYDEDNEKCQRLKKTLNFDCVKQITTRDDYESLTQFKEKEDMLIGKVSDPAVFTAPVFRNFVSQEKQKKIGVFVLRANGFKDNKVDFDRDASAKLWKDLADVLEARGYDYEFITSGHFGDEAFLDLLIKKYNLPESKCVFNMNAPDELIRRISSYEGVVSCRLHPSIISFSLDVPAVGLVWNSKVKFFYDSIGYGDRALEMEDITAEKVADALEMAISQGVKKSPEYMMTVYQSLYSGIQKALGLAPEDSQMYTYEELLTHIPAWQGDSEAERALKLKRKYRRTYGKYNDIFEQSKKRGQEVKKLRAEVKKLKKQLEEQKTFMQKLKEKIKAYAKKHGVMK